MKNIREKSEKYGCTWLVSYLTKLKRRSLKDYNRVKTLLYYFPNIMSSLNVNSLNMAISHADQVHLSLSRNDISSRYKVFDEIYFLIHDKEFDEICNSAYEVNYITLEDFFKYFKI